MTLTIGVDFDSYALHVCGLPTGGNPPVVVSVSIRKKGEDEHRAIITVGHAFGVACEAIQEARREQAKALDPERWERIVVKPGVKVSDPPTSVWIERGFGASRKADFVLGAIYGATFVAAAHVLPHVAARPLLAGDWKRDLTGEMGITTKTGGRGNGNVKKEIANDCARQLWAREWPLTIVPTDPNQLDAFSIAWTGSRL